MLKTPQIEPCFRVEGATAAGGSRYESGALVDLDSELIGISRHYSRCDEPIKQFPHTSTIVFSDCKKLTAEPTRYSNPALTLKDNGVNRFTPLCRNPQANVEKPFDWLVNNRLIVKDSHRPCVEFPMEQNFPVPPEHAQTYTITNMQQWSSLIPDRIKMTHQNPPMLVTCTSPAYLEKL